MANRETVRVALLGAGERGQLMFGLFARKHPRLFKYVAVAEPNQERRSRFQMDFGIPRENVFADWRDLLAKPQLADAVINAMPDVRRKPPELAPLATCSSSRSSPSFRSCSSPSFRSCSSSRLIHTLAASLWHSFFAPHLM